MSRHDFQRDGAVYVRGAFSPEEVALVERGIERNLAEPSDRALVASRPDDPGRFFEDCCNWQRMLADELPVGAAMDHELFPVLWEG